MVALRLNLEPELLYQHLPALDFGCPLEVHIRQVLVISLKYELSVPQMVLPLLQSVENCVRLFVGDTPSLLS